MSTVSPRNIFLSNTQKKTLFPNKIIYFFMFCIFFLIVKPYNVIVIDAKTFWHFLAGQKRWHLTDTI